MYPSLKTGMGPGRFELPTSRYLKPNIFISRALHQAKLRAHKYVKDANILYNFCNNIRLRGVKGNNMKEKGKYDFHQNMLLLTVVLLGGLSLTIFAIDQGFSVTGMVTGIEDVPEEPLMLQGIGMEVGDTVTFDLDLYFDEEGTFYDFRTSDGYTSTIDGSLVTVEGVQSGTWTMRGFAMINDSLEETGDYILEVRTPQETQEQATPGRSPQTPPGLVNDTNQTPENISETPEVDTPENDTENISETPDVDTPENDTENVSETPEVVCEDNQCDLDGQCLDEGETQNNMICKNNNLYTEQRFNILDEDNELFLVDNEGHTWLKGNLIQNCEAQPTGRYYQVVDEQRLFFINSTGDMCLTGQLFENSNVQTACENTNCFTVGEENDVLGITSSGDMHITGTLTQ